jgi:hypothetical protein
MLMQMLALSPEQINALPPTERDSIQQLVRPATLSRIRADMDTCLQRNQFMGGAFA